MHPLDLRENRFRLQQLIAKLEEDEVAARQALEAQVAALQELCEHPNFDEDPVKGWRCRDCDLAREPEKPDEPEVEVTASETPPSTATTAV